MFSNIIIVVVFILLIGLLCYKREILIQIFSMNVPSPANRFQEELQQTADLVIKRLEEQVTHLEYLIEEANEKITSLDNKIQMANNILNFEDNNINKCLNTSISLDENTNLGTVTTGIAKIGLDNYKALDRNDKRCSIIEMAELGYDITEIAKATGISKGEIMLLLQLNKK